MTNFFEPLKEKDIIEKININKEKGLDLSTFRDIIYQEMFTGERLILKTENELLKLKIQHQNYLEQIKVIDDLLRKEGK